MKAKLVRVGVTAALLLAMLFLFVSQGLRSALAATEVVNRNVTSGHSLPSAECTTTQIKISEVEADPPAGTTEPDDEWFELYNTGSSSTMTGWTITDNNSSDTIPTLNIAANGHMIVAATTGFDTNHPSFSGARVLVSDGVIGGGLANAADFLRLRDGNSTDAECVAWGNPTGNPCSFSTGALNDNTNRTKQRTPSDGTDTDTENDWINATETPSGTPTTVTLSTFTARADAPSVPAAASGLGMLTVLGVGVGVWLARRGR